MTVAWTLASANPGVIFNNFGASTALTYTNINGGTAFPAGSTVVLFLGNSGQTVTDPTLITIGGTTLTKAYGDFTGTGSLVELWYADLSGSTIDTLVVTIAPFTWYYIDLVVGYLTGVATGGPSTGAQQQFGSQNSPINVTETIPVGGIGVFSVASYLQGTPPGQQTITWTNVTGDTPNSYYASNGTTDWAEISTARTVTSGSVTANAANPNLAFGSGMVCGAWNAGSGGDILISQVWM